MAAKTGNRTFYISNRVFHALWDLCEKWPDADSYIHSIVRENERLMNRLWDTGMKYDRIVSFLKDIYDAHALSFNDIRERSGLGPAEISHIFCIPIRTIEAWMSGRSVSPSYVRLMMLRYFGLLVVDRRIRFEFGEIGTGNNAKAGNSVAGSRYRTTAEVLSGGERSDKETSALNAVGPDGILERTDYLRQVLLNRKQDAE